MSEKTLEQYTLEEVAGLLKESIGAVIIVDGNRDKYRALIKKGFFQEIIDDEGTYKALIERFWFHFEDSNEKPVGDYNAFVSYYGVFKGKYSRRLKLYKDGSEEPTIVQINVYPLKEPGFYIFTLDELAEEYKQEFLTSGKVNTIQSAYLFSMYVDLNENTINSISVSEVSDETVNGTMKYTDWRLMIVNMIWPEDKDRFLSLTDPEYLRANLEPGRTTSFDCQMANLEGKFIWVKLIFSRARTINEDDFRFVFMVQDINDDSLELLATLKKYEEQATYDSLTGLLNRGTVKAQICNALEKVKEEGRPLSLMMLDLDFFKDVNDKFGHFAGDATLKRFASIISNEMEGLDAAVGRWGGEEFIIACPGKNLDYISETAENVRKAVETATFVDVGNITCSIGVTEVKKTDSFEDAFERVDKALYASKENGRNRVTVL